MNERVGLTCVALLGLGCASQTLIMARTSSGAVDHDVEFVPRLGADGHYISLPAYPLSNCTDTLVYERLADDFDVLLQQLGSVPAKALKTSVDVAAKALKTSIDLEVKALKTSGTTDNPGLAAKWAALDFWRELLATKVGAVIAGDDVVDDKRSDAAKGLVSAFHPGGPASRGPSTDLAEALLKPRWRLDPHRLFRKRETVGEWKKRDPGGANAYLATYLKGIIADSATDFDHLLQAGSKDKFTAGDLVTVMKGAGVVNIDALAAAAEKFVSYADDYGPAACASAPRYRDFLGFRRDGGVPERRVSWLDRSSCTQLDVLSAIESLNDGKPHHPDCAADISKQWPSPIQSFLHFSDVQIREPSAKLGGAELSHELKQLVYSFEQDYVQEQYSMFVYDALVQTANAEICLHKKDDQEHVKAAERLGFPACPSPEGPPERHPIDEDTKKEKAEQAVSADDALERPAPVLMIHTGDTADTGLQSEFDTFLTTTNTLHAPWYEAIGNHDVLTFGNLQLVGQNLPRWRLLEDSKCQGASWNGVGCTCTSIGTLIREKEIRGPDNRGHVSNALPEPVMALFPLALQRICLLHAVQADWFVMDPDKVCSGDPTKSFVLSHCQGWRPPPRNLTTSEQTAAGKALDQCLGTKDAEENLCTPPKETRSGPPKPTKPPARCVTFKERKSRTSQFHGFDYLPGFEQQLKQVPDGSANENLGYYCFEMDPLKDQKGQRKVWAIVLNTNTDAGAHGYVSQTQMNWLGELLHGAGQPGASIGANDLVMLFAHHPVYVVYDQKQRLELTQLITGSPNVIGYFAGHTHESGLRVIRPLSGTAGTAKWEIVAPSVIDYPQALRQVTLKSIGDLGYIEVLTFTSGGDGPAVAKIKAAGQGAVRDNCASHPERCIDGHAVLPGREIEFPRLYFRMPGARAESASAAR